MAFLLSSLLVPIVVASPTLVSNDSLEQTNRLVQQQRDVPAFPPFPPSCPICEQNFNTINSCAQAAPVLANFSNIIFNPGSFVDIIKCACTDTFQAAYPQCADCFMRTNQEELLNSNTEDLPNIIKGMRQICGLESTLNGNVSAVNGETTPSLSSTTQPTSTSNAARSMGWGCPLLLSWILILVTGISRSLS